MERAFLTKRAVPLTVSREGFSVSGVQPPRKLPRGVGAPGLEDGEMGLASTVPGAKAAVQVEARVHTVLASAFGQ